MSPIVSFSNEKKNKKEGVPGVKIGTMFLHSKLDISAFVISCES